MRQASARRVALSAPRVSARKIGALPTGLTMGSSAATTRRNTVAKWRRLSSSIGEAGAALIVRRRRAL
jgi:hypothetical protein